MQALFPEVNSLPAQSRRTLVYVLYCTNSSYGFRKFRWSCGWLPPMAVPRQGLSGWSGFWPRMCCGSVDVIWICMLAKPSRVFGSPETVEWRTGHRRLRAVAAQTPCNLTRACVGTKLGREGRIAIQTGVGLLSITGMLLCCLPT